MPIIDRKIADELFTDIGPDDTFYRGIYFCATVGVGPVVLLWNIWAHERQYKRTYLPQRVMDRAAALKTPHRQTIAKAIKARQWPGVFWLLVAGNFTALILLLMVVLSIETSRWLWERRARW